MKICEKQFLFSILFDGLILNKGFMKLIRGKWK